MIQPLKSRQMNDKKGYSINYIYRRYRRHIKNALKMIMIKGS